MRRAFGYPFRVSEPFSVFVRFGGGGARSEGAEVGKF